ncbi:MAG: hypothetical protein RR636_01500 [Clostridium sp.]|uniref:hypothetical protein n=1 Tax=Clostridium sp. TaxID=1506 RepID=UPI00304379BD
MKKLQVDLALLLELSLTETRGEGECYINLNNGEFSYIPQGIIEALEDESKFNCLESWEIELANDAQDIVMNYDDKYLYIPLIEDNVLISSMKQFLETLADDIRTKIIADVDWSNSFLTFNKSLVNNNKLDDFYIFRDEFLYNYLVKWLENNYITIV